MNMLGPLRNEIVRLPGDLKHFSGSGKNLSGDEEGDELFADLPKIHVSSHQEIFVAPVGVSQGIGIVFKNEDVTG